MRFALVWTFASLALAAPLTPLEGAPGEVVTLVFRGQGEVRLPQGFVPVLAPEALDGVVVLSVRVPQVPPGVYPVGFGEATYPFRVKGLERAFLQPLSSPEIAPGEVGEVQVRVVNLGNLPLALPPKVVGVGVEVVAALPQTTLSPGEEALVRVRVRGMGREGKVLLFLAGGQAEAKVGSRPTLPGPFHGFATLPSLLRYDTQAGLSLEGRGALLDPYERSLGTLGYRLSPQGGSLDYGNPLFGLGLSFSPQAAALSLRYRPVDPLNLFLEGSTTGSARFGLAYAEGPWRLGGRLALPFAYALEAGLAQPLEGGQLGLSGRLASEGWGVEARYARSGLSLSAAHGAPGGTSLMGVAALGGGFNLGLGLRFREEAVLVGLLGVPLLGTVEARGEWGLGSGRFSASLFHILRSQEDLFYESLSWDGRALTYRLQAQGSLPTEWGMARVGGGLGLGGGTLSLEAQAALPPFSLGASLGFAGGGLRSFRLGGSLAFDLPLYPLAWPLLEAKVEGGATSLVVEGPRGRYLLPLDPEGRGALRLPPGRYRLEPPKGQAFLREGRLVPDLPLDLGPEGAALALKVLPALRVGLALTLCPLEARPGYVRGIPGVDLEALLPRLAVRLVGPVEALLTQGGYALLVPGRYRPELSGPLTAQAYLALPGGEGPVEEVEVREEGVLRLCLAFPERPVEEQEVK